AADQFIRPESQVYDQKVVHPLGVAALVAEIVADEVAAGEVVGDGPEPLTGVLLQILFQVLLHVRLEKSVCQPVGCPGSSPLAACPLADRELANRPPLADNGKLTILPLVVLQILATADAV